MDKPVAPGDTFTTPPENEIKLRDLALQIRAVMPFECRYLTGETDFVSTNYLAQLIDPQAVQPYFIKRQERLSPEAAT